MARKKKERWRPPKVPNESGNKDGSSTFLPPHSLADVEFVASKTNSPSHDSRSGGLVRQLLDEMPKRKFDKSLMESKAGTSASISCSLGEEDTASSNSISSSENGDEESTNEEIEETPKNPPPMATWAGLFRDNRVYTESLKIEYVQPVEEVITLDPEDVSSLEDEWGHCLIGRFAGRFPGLLAIQHLVNSWKVKCNILPHSKGWVVFQLTNEEDMAQILRNGPYAIYGRTLILKRMPEGFLFDEEQLTVIPIWVQLPGLPLECWNHRALGKISSRLGNPICMDKITAQKKRISYARVLIEVDVAKELIDYFKICLPSGKSYFQKAHYENLPSYCTGCKAFGHESLRCKRHATTPAEANDSRREGLNSAKKHHQHPVPSATNAVVQISDLPTAQTCASADHVEHSGSLNIPETVPTAKVPKLQKNKGTAATSTSNPPTAQACISAEFAEHSGGVNITESAGAAEVPNLQKDKSKVPASTSKKHEEKRESSKVSKSNTLDGSKEPDSLVPCKDKGKQVAFFTDNPKSLENVRKKKKGKGRAPDCPPNPHS